MQSRIGKWRLPPNCVACGAVDSYVRNRSWTEKVCYGETLWVEHAHWKCEQCGVGILGPSEADEAVRATASAYRSKHGLLTPERGSIATHSAHGLLAFNPLFSLEKGRGLQKPPAP